MSLDAKFIQGIVRPGISTVQLAPTCSGWFVANTDAKTAESDSDDPAESALTVPQTKAFVFDLTGKTYVDLTLFYVGTDNSAAVDVVAFGFWPVASARDVGAIEPNTISTSYPASTAAHVGGGFWAPLYAPIPGGTHVQSFALGAAEVVVNGASPNYKLKGGVTYAATGAYRGIVLIRTATADPTVALVLARVGN